MKILLTGAGGQLAHDLTPRLAEAGHEVVKRDSKGLDVTDRDKVLKAVEDLRPGVIINTAAYTRVDQAEKENDAALAVNKKGPANLADGAKKNGALLMHISTDFVFDGLKSTPYNETDPARPLGVYGRTKLEGEEEVAKRLTEYFIIRTSWLYGTHGKNFVKTMVKLAGEKERLRVVYDQAGSPTWTADLAGAIVNIIKGKESGKNAYGLYHYSNEGVASWYDFAKAIIEESSIYEQLICKTLEPVLTPEYPTPAKRPAYSVLDKHKIKETFGITIPYWRSSLRKMLKELYGGGHA